MFTLQEISLLALLPGFVGLLVVFLGSPRKQEMNAAGPSLPTALAIAAAVLLAGLLTSGIHIRPREAFDWLVLLPALAAIAGILLVWVRGLFGILVVAGAGALSSWLLAVPGISTIDAIAALAAPGLVYAFLLRPARHNSGAVFAASWFIVAAATTCVSMASTGITFGKYTIAPSAVAGGVFLALLWRRHARLGPAGLAAFVLIWTALLVYGYEWVDVPRWRVLVLLAAPLGMWIGELPGMRRRPRARSVISLACVAALAATAAVPAVLELLQTLRSQTQVGGY